MVCLALAFAIVAGVDQDQESKPLFPRLFPNPTGQNALEYYVQASDLADVRGAELWNPPYDGDRFGNIFPEAEEMARRTVDLLGLVRAGNKHPYIIPREGIGAGARTAVTKVARLLRQYAYVQFARGRPDAGTDVLLLLIEMSQGMYGAGAVRDDMHAWLLNLFAMGVFDGLYTSISLNGAEGILRRVPLPGMPIFGESWRKETARISATIDDPSLWIYTGFAGGIYEQMSASDRVEAKAQWSRLAQAVAADLAGFTIENESEWATMALRMKEYAAQVTAPLSPLVGLEALETVVLNDIQNRTTLRLLRVHALIATFRWRRGVLPLSLDELPAEAHFDPGTGKPYVYQRLTESAYDLYSVGSSWHGAIRLRDAGPRPRVDDRPPSFYNPFEAVATSFH